eukprot:13719319-Alexandrium_andersonii.AAC.1
MRPRAEPAGSALSTVFVGNRYVVLDVHSFAAIAHYLLVDVRSAAVYALGLRPPPCSCPSSPARGSSGVTLAQ